MQTEEELNTIFASVFIAEDTSNVSEHQESQGAEFIGVAINKEKMLGQLKGVKVDKSPGPDWLHPRLLNEVDLEFVGALVVIFR